MKNQELKALLKTLRAFGTVSYKCDGVELLLDPNFVSTKPALKSRLTEVKSLQEQIDKHLPQLDDESWLLAGVKPEEPSEV